MLQIKYVDFFICIYLKDNHSQKFKSKMYFMSSGLANFMCFDYSKQKIKSKD